jgi:hypothetical protein
MPDASELVLGADRVERESAGAEAASGRVRILLVLRLLEQALGADEPSLALLVQLESRRPTSAGFAASNETCGDPRDHVAALVVRVAADCRAAMRLQTVLRLRWLCS